jgi:hypothetical protein
VDHVEVNRCPSIVSTEVRHTVVMKEFFPEVETKSN